MTPTPAIVKHGLLSLQVCVPADWTDAQIVEFANAAQPCGTTLGWSICRAGDPALGGDPERAACLEHDAHVHVMLDA